MTQQVFPSFVADDYDCALAKFTRSIVKGCVMRSCQKCQRPLSLTPSQQKMHLARPNTELVCRTCFLGFKYMPLAQFGDNDLINKSRLSVICRN